MDNRQNQANINWYPGHMAKTKRLIKDKIKWIDIVFEVIDARIPYSSKIKDIDSFTSHKPKLLLMTKVDLCDIKETKKWEKYYESLGYKVLLLNLTKNQNITKEIIKMTNEMMKPILEKRKQKGMKNRKTRILVVGIPNVGKSTLINCLTNRKSVKVGNKPGVTKNLDWIRVNENLELLDTPGVLWPKFENEKVAFHLASFTAIKEEVLPLEEVGVYILRALSKYYPTISKDRYGITEIESDIVPILDQIGKKRGCLRKGGQVDYEKVYTTIINDIKNGYIKNITFDKLEELEKSDLYFRKV